MESDGLGQGGTTVAVECAGDVYDRQAATRRLVRQMDRCEREHQSWRSLSAAGNRNCEARARATVFFCGLGFSELTIDGRKIGDYVIGPGFTTYDKRVQYLAFDVTDRFATPGRKTLDVILADGWYALERDPWVHQFEKRAYVDKPKLLLDLHLQFADGSETAIGSDDNWRWSDGEITRSWIAQEDIDRRKTARNWRPVALVAGPAGKLVSQREPFNRIVDEMRPVSMKFDAEKKAWVWDFGREINGWVRLRAAGPAGTEIAVTTIPIGAQPRTSRFILAGTGEKELYEPRFFHAGMRQVEVTGLASKPDADDLVGCQVSSMYAPSGSFRCSDELQNWLNDSARRTVVSYTTFLPNDPVREWKGWTEDMENMFRSAVYLFDSQTMYERWQHGPARRPASRRQLPERRAGPVLRRLQQSLVGRLRRLAAVALVSVLRRRVAVARELSGDETLRGLSRLGRRRDGFQDWGLADWLPVEETPRAMINTPAHFLYAQIVSRTAEMLGQRDDARRYAEIAENVRAAFNQKFPRSHNRHLRRPRLETEGGQLGTARAVGAVARNLVDRRPALHASRSSVAVGAGHGAAESRAAVEKALLREIAAHRNHVSTGFVSTPYLLQVLADLAPDVGWAMTSARDFPSWYSMTRGSGNDLMKETWAGGMALMPSLGGNIAAWHTEALAGIRPAAPGFKKILIKPAFVGDLTWVKAHHDSPYGRIVSQWKRENGRLTMDVEIPANTSATVYVRATDVAQVTESDKPIAQALGVNICIAKAAAWFSPLNRAATASPPCTMSKPAFTTLTALLPALPAALHTPDKLLER